MTTVELDAPQVEPGTWKYSYAPFPRQLAFHSCQADEILFGGAGGPGKDLALDTPVLTTEGWSSQGALRVGDFVYNEEGDPVRVIAAYPVEANPCYRVTFSNGQEIVAGQGHLWTVATAADRSHYARSRPEWQAQRRATRASRAVEQSQKPWVSKSVTARNSATAALARQSQTPADRWHYTRTLETHELAALTATERERLSVPITAPLLGTRPWQAPFVPPWVMGMWLGDGTRLSGAITSGVEDAQLLLERMHSNGYDLRRVDQGQTYYFDGGNGSLNINLSPVFGAGKTRRKHIPDWVFACSYEDRLAVVQGLMDSDGTVADDGGSELCLTDEQLIGDAVRLISSLGIRVSVRSSDASITDPDGTRRVVGTRWRALFATAAAVFTYPRKLNKLISAPTSRRESVYIVSVDPVDTVPTRCIAVDSARQLYLAGDTLIPTHNTDALLAECVTLCLAVPNIKVILFRRTFGELEDEIIPRLQARIPDSIASYNSGKHQFKFHHNGAIFRLGYMERDADKYRYIGAEYQLIAWDELTQQLKGNYEFMKTRLRAAGQVAADLARLGTRPRMIASTNPGGRGHGWVKRMFLDPCAFPDTVFETPLFNGKTVTRAYYPARASDNPALDVEEYEKQLSGVDEMLRRAIMEGDWNVLEGARFSAFRKEVHTIPPGKAPIPIVGYPRAVGVDYGMKNPFAAVWGALMHDDLVVIYRELYRTELTPRQQAELIRDSEQEGERLPSRPIPIALDPACWARDPNSLQPANAAGAPQGSIAWHYQQVFGGQVVRARNDRLAGWSLVDQGLLVRADGWPRLLIHQTCPNLIRVLPEQMRDKKNPEDVDTNGSEDHLPDAVRYLLFQLLKGGSDRTTPNADPLARAVPPVTAGLATTQF